MPTPEYPEDKELEDIFANDEEGKKDIWGHGIHIREGLDNVFVDDEETKKLIEGL